MASGPDRNSLRWRMTNHRPTDEEVNQIERLRAVAILLGEHMEEVCPEGRERALAITHLETSLMWAVAAIARATDNAD